MRLRITTLTAVLLLTVCAGMTLAGDPSGHTTLPRLGHGADINYTHTPLRDFTVWCQGPSFVDAIVSQDDYSASNVDGVNADDFESATDYAITFAEWWGGTYGPSNCVDYFIITFYGHNEICDAPDEGTIISQQLISDYNDVDLGNLYHSYSSELDPVLMDAGRKYWITIVAYTDGDLCNWWYWALSSDAWNCDGLFRGDYFGHPDWVSNYSVFGDPEYRAQAFCLYSDQSVVAEPATWGNVKALYE